MRLLRLWLAMTNGGITVMRYAILADIHGNLVAFKAVLKDMEARGGFSEIKIKLATLLGQECLVR